MPMKTLLRAPEREEKGGSTLCSALAASLLDSLDSKVEEEAEFCTGARLTGNPASQLFGLR
jgi:hypothetical protein